MFDVDVNPEQLEKFTQNSNQDKFVMLNLLKFKAAGRKEDYARYRKDSTPFASGVVVTVAYFGIPEELLIGRDEWDLLMLVQYPSRQAFLDLINNPDYLTRIIHHSRGASLCIRYHSVFASFANTGSIRSVTKSTVVSNPHAIRSRSGDFYGLMDILIYVAYLY